MKKLSPEVAERRLRNKYHKLAEMVDSFVNTLQSLEPGGTIINEVSFKENDMGTVRIGYAARPFVITIEKDGKIFILKVQEQDKPPVHD